MKRAAFPPLILLVMVGFAMSARVALAQELEPRSFVNTPVGLNFLIAGQGYIDGDVVFSAALPVTDGEVQTHSGVLAYIRSVDVRGLSGKFGVIVPYAAASGSAKLRLFPTRERNATQTTSVVYGSDHENRYRHPLSDDVFSGFVVTAMAPRGRKIRGHDNHLFVANSTDDW